MRILYLNKIAASGVITATCVCVCARARLRDTHTHTHTHTHVCISGGCRGRHLWACSLPPFPGAAPLGRWVCLCCKAATRCIIIQACNCLYRNSSSLDNSSVSE